MSYIGHEAIFYLDSAKQTVYSIADTERTPENILMEKKSKNCLAMKIYAQNDTTITQFSLSAYNSVKVVKEALLRSKLSIDEINDLKNLFFRNIGFIQLGIIEDISEKFREYLELATGDYNYDCDIDCGKLSKAIIFLKPILKFRETIFTEEKIKEIKENWNSEFGTHA